MTTTVPAVQPAPAPKKEKLPRELDPRNPNFRLEALLDYGSVELITADDDSGMLAAVGTVNGCRVVAFCSDPTVMGGAMGVDGCEVVVRAYERAMADRVPVIGIWHSGGARLAEGVLSLHAVGRIFHAMTQASGQIPQISIVLGFAAGGAAYGPALTDVVILAPEGRIFVTGPDVVRSVTGEDVDMLRLGGPDTHGRRSGVVHVVADDEQHAIDEGRRLTTLLASQGQVAVDVADDDLASLLPASPKRAYDVHPLINGLLDEGSTLELHARWAPNVTVALGRLAGRTVGVVANNPLRLGGCLDSLSAEKAARFVRMCDTFGVPLVVLVDVPGYLPGVGQEWDGVVRRGAKLLHAFAEAVVPRVTLVTRKAYGGAYIAMNARSLGATKVFAWPGAEVAVMGPVAAVRILHRRKLAGVADDVRLQVEAELAAEHERIAGGVEKAVEIGVVDEIVSPAATRSALAAAVREADSGRRERTPTSRCDSGAGDARELSAGTIGLMRALWNGTVIADSDDTVVVERNHYFPRASLVTEHFVASDRTSVCPWKGTASYLSVTVDGETNPDAAWYYPEPKPEAAEIQDRVAFWRGVSVQRD